GGRLGGRAGFPQDHPAYQGVLSSARDRLRDQLAPYDALLVVGAPVFRQTAFAPGRFTAPNTAIAVVGDDPDEVHRSPAELSVLAPIAPVVRELAARVPQRASQPPAPRPAPVAPAPPGEGEPLTASHVL